MITGATTLIAQLGYPTHTFTSPRLYNPWFEQRGIDAVIVPMGVRTEGYPDLFRSLFTVTNLRAALITMPHKINTLELVDVISPTARVAGATNAVIRREDGTLHADQFDGAGFVRGMLRKGFRPAGRRALIIGNGGVGSPIAASLAAAGIAELGLHDPNAAASHALAERLGAHFPEVHVLVGPGDPEGFDLIVNATPLGMHDGDPLPVDVTRIPSHAFVGDVVLRTELTPFLRAADQQGCTIQVGADMLFEMVPAVLEFLGFPAATPEEFRRMSATPTRT